MPAQPSGAGRDLAKIVEKQMRNWEFTRAQHVDRLKEIEEQAAVAPFIALSRAIGSGGSQVATQLGEQLAWPVFDRELLQNMAGDDQMRKHLYELMDERDVSWLEDTVRWLVQGELRRDDYFYRLSETVLALARKGPAVFLGRASDLILPRDRGLRVQITALPATRAQALKDRMNTSETMARTEVERIDRERVEFRRKHFGANANEPANFDLSISLDYFDTAQAVELILAAMRLRRIEA